VKTTDHYGAILLRLNDQIIGARLRLHATDTPASAHKGICQAIACMGQEMLRLRHEMSLKSAPVGKTGRRRK